MTNISKDSDSIKEMYQTTFQKIEATDDMKAKFKENVKLNPINKTGSSKFKKYKIIASAACFLLIVVILNFNSIKAGVLNLYEYFFSTTILNYDESAEGYIINVNKKVKLEDDLSVEIEQAVFVEGGIEFKWKALGNTEKYVFYPIDAAVKSESLEGESLICETTAHSDEYYISSMVFYNNTFGEERTNWNETLGEKLSFEIQFNCYDSDKLKADDNSMDAYACEDTTIELIPNKIYKTKYSDITYNDGYHEIKSVEKKVWYIKVEYKALFDINKIAREQDPLPFPVVKCNGEELLFFSGCFDDGYEDDDIVKNSVPYLCYSLPEKQGNDFEIKTIACDISDISSKYLNVGKDLTDWKKIHVDWKEK